MLRKFCEIIRTLPNNLNNLIGSFHNTINQRVQGPRLSAPLTLKLTLRDPKEMTMTRTP